MPTLAIVSHKGGSGKSTVTANLAGAIAAGGQRVLAVDVDPQGGLGAALGISPAKPTVYEVLLGNATAREATVATETDGISVISADLDLAGAEVELPGRAQWRFLLRNQLRPEVQRYAAVLLDTPPGLGVLSFAAVCAADAAVVVCPPEFMAYRALPDVLDMVKRAGIPVLGIVPTFAQRATRHAREVAEALEADYRELLLSPIPRRVALQDAALAGVPITRLQPSSDAAGAFVQLAKEVLSRAKKNSARSAHAATG